MIKYENALRQSAAYRLIKNDIDKNALSHAYMVVSPDGEAVRELFRLVAAAVFCNSGACLDCDSCRRVLQGNNPDVVYLNIFGKKISSDDINQLIESTYLTPGFGERKLYFVLSAGDMSAAAQNKLLKTLEEPPENVSIFLGVKNEEGVLQTIRSRVRSVVLEPFDWETVYREIFALTGDEVRSRSAAAFSGGLLGAAERIALSGHTDLYDKAFELLNSVRTSRDVAAALKNSAFDKESFPAFLDILSVIFRDMLAAKSDPGLIETKHRKEEITAMSGDYSSLALSKIIYLINEERKMLNFNVGSASVAENLLFGILEVKHICR